MNLARRTWRSGCPSPKLSSLRVSLHQSLVRNPDGVSGKAQIQTHLTRIKCNLSLFYVGMSFAFRDQTLEMFSCLSMFESSTFLMISLFSPFWGTIRDAVLMCNVFTKMSPPIQVNFIVDDVQNIPFSIYYPSLLSLVWLIRDKGN